MRFRFLLSVLILSVATPAVAQPQPNLERRVGRLEQEMRAVQRRVFPGGAGATVDPEIGAQPQPTQPTTAPGGNAITTLNARIEAIEAQLARVTGQVEENGFRLTQLEEQLRQLRSDTQERLGRLEQAAARPEPAAPEAVLEPEATDPAPETTSPTLPTRPLDAAQDAYNAGFRLWEGGRYAEAATALLAVAERYPRSRWASWAKNLAGRAYLDDNKPAQAARVFLDNYQTNQSGERAADSLFFLGEALVKLNRRTEACPVYDELESKFPDMRAFLRERLPAARRAARCS